VFWPECLIPFSHFVSKSFVLTKNKNIRSKKATTPLVGYYDKKGVAKTFQGTMSDVIYPEVKKWLDEKLH